MTDSSKMLDALHTLVLDADRFRRISLPKKVSGLLIDLASLATLRRQLGENRPLFIGFIGCTGTGKSTLFNSFAGQEVSLTGWRVHNTCGPVLLMPDRALKKLAQWETKFGPLLLPALKRNVQSLENDQADISENLKKGSPDTLYIISQSDEKQMGLPGRGAKSGVFFDLPDINSSPALEENLIALDVLPWLDIVIFAVDDETVFHKIYGQPVQLANELEQHRFCVLSDRGKSRVDLNHPDIKQAMAFFGVDAIHILPELKEKGFFADEPAFVGLRQAIQAQRKIAPQQPLLKKIAKLAQLAVEENGTRQQALKSLEKELSQMITTTFVKDASIALEKILHDDVLQALRHLGLKRFAVSNLLHFFKTAASSGSLKHGFKLSFGNRRDKILAPKLRFDRQKLGHEVSKRLADCREHILVAIGSHPDIDIIRGIIPNLNAIISGDLQTDGKDDESQPFNEDLDKIAGKFEQACAELLASDSVSKVIQNDPLLAAALVAAFAVDVFGFHGFLGWLLVPTAFKYLPFGKFAAIKRSFQNEVRHIVQKQLLLITGKINDLRFRIVLEDQDPLLQALNVCAR